MTEDVCRLCLITSDLVWIFDNRIAEPGNMKEVIHITTGIEIKNTDTVTQNVCKKCCCITLKMFKFRTTALKNDKELKNRLLDLKVKTEKNISPECGQARVAPDKVVEEFTTCMSRNAAINSATQKPLNGFVESAGKTSDIPSRNKPHNTATELLHKYPQLKIPRSCLQSNLFPAIAIDSDEVATWFSKKRKRDQAKEIEASEVKYKLLCTKSPVNVTQGPNIGIDQNVIEPSSEKVPKLVRSVALSEISSAKRKMSSEIPMFKRKLSSDTMSSCSSDADRDELFSHPELTALQKCLDGGEPELLSHINKSTNVHVCTICNAITYSNREMKSHSRKHTVCPFCKVRFRTVEAKNSHVDRECPIKSIMQNLPALPLVRVDEVKSLTEKYRTAFDCVHVVSSDDEGVDNTDILITADSDKPLAMDVDCKTISGQEEDSKGAATVDTSKSPDLVSDNNSSNDNIAIGIGVNGESIEVIDITVDDDVVYISDDEAGSEPPKNLKIDTDESQTPENHPPQSNMSEPQLEMKLLTSDTEKTANEPLRKLENAVDSAVKLPSKCGAELPLFSMSNIPLSNALNSADKEAGLIRMLLREADMCHGLLPPTNKSITIQGTTDKIYALKNIVHYLRKYKMPVDLSFNDKLTVSYEPVKPSRQDKEVEIWDPNMALPQRSMIPQPVVNNPDITYSPTVNNSVTHSNVLTKTPTPAGNTTDIRLSTDSTPVTGIQLPTKSTLATGFQISTNTTSVIGISRPTNCTRVPGAQLPTNSTPVPGTQLPTNTPPVIGIPPPADSTRVTGSQLPTNSTPVTGIKLHANYTPVTGTELPTPVTGIQLPINSSPVTGIQFPTKNTPVSRIQYPTNYTPVTGIQLPTTTGPVTVENVSTIGNMENRSHMTSKRANYPGQHMPTVPSYAQIARAMDASGPPNITCTNSRPIVLNPLLNKSISSRPIVNNGVYNSSSERTVVTSGIFTPGRYTYGYSARTAFGVDSHFHSPVTARELEFSPTIRAPPPSYTTSVLRHYRPQSMRGMEHRSRGVPVTGLRVKTADELNQKF